MHLTKLILKQTISKGTKFHCIFVASVLLTSISGVIAAPPPSTLAEANKLFDKQQWQAAERAYEVVARGASGKEKYEAQYKAAVCMEFRKETGRAVSNFNQIIINAGALRDAPEIVAKAHGRLHAIYLPQKNSTPQRERVVAECVRRLPNHEVSIRLCEAEAEFWIAKGNTQKAVGYYKLGGGAISDAAKSALALLSSNAALADSDIEALAKIAKAKPALVETIAPLVAKRPDGWRAELFHASFLADSGQGARAAAILESLLKSGRGPGERIALARAETLAAKTNDTAAADKAYRDWLAAFPRSELRAKAHYQYGVFLNAKGRFAEAAAQFEAAQLGVRSGEKLGVRSVELGVAGGASDNVASHYAAAAAVALEKNKAALTEADKKKAEAEKLRLAEANKPKPPPPGALEKSLANGLKLQEEKRFQAARMEYQGFRGKMDNPLWGKAWHHLGECLRDMGDTPRAIAAWTDVWNRYLLFPDTRCALEARLSSAVVFLEDEADAASALQCFEDVLARKPDIFKDEKLETAYAIASLAAGKSETARAFFQRKREQAEADKNEFRQFYWERMSELCDGAKPELLKSGMAADRAARSRLFVGDFYFEAGSHKKALKQYTLALANLSGEDAARAMMQQARCMAASGDVNAALKQYDELLRKHPSSAAAPEALLRVGVIWAGQKNNSDTAEKHFERLCFEYPKSAAAETAQLYVATLAWWDKKWEKAERLCRAFIDKHPDSSAIAMVETQMLPAIAARTN
jgi:Uncharacterized protein conserved in bacteria